jgi:hypothetical protein
VLKPDYVAKVASLCHDHGLALHMDGARIMNAAVALKVRVCGWACVRVCVCARAAASWSVVLLSSVRVRRSLLVLLRLFLPHCPFHGALPRVPACVPSP